MQLDSKDEKILEALKQNSRKTVRDIAKKTGIRPSTVHQRINRLIKSGVIEKFTVKLNNKEVHENFIAFVSVKTKKNLDEKIFHNKNIKEVFGVTGKYDLILKVKVGNIDEFNDFIINFRKNLDIDETLTTISTATIKEEM